MDVASNEAEVCAEPEPRVRFRAFGASSLDIDLLCWVENPELRGRVLDTLNTTIYKRFREEGIEIPYSKHDLYIKEMPQ
jgi:small-conductance mechanosensitive channel